MFVRSRWVALALVVMLGGCQAESIDDPDGSPPPPDPELCADWERGECLAGEGRQLEDFGGRHVADPEPISWDDDPPASGPHRPEWARWGEYTALPPERWLHNLEHGGAALLYHPCAGAEVVDALRELARARPGDAGGRFRWVLTPYPELPTAVAVVTWEWRYLATCVRADEIDEFLDRHYRDAPEDIAGDGSFEEGWLGR